MVGGGGGGGGGGGVTRLTNTTGEKRGVDEGSQICARLINTTRLPVLIDKMGLVCLCVCFFFFGGGGGGGCRWGTYWMT